MTFNQSNQLFPSPRRTRSSRRRTPSSGPLSSAAIVVLRAPASRRASFVVHGLPLTAVRAVRARTLCAWRRMPTAGAQSINRPRRDSAQHSRFRRRQRTRFRCAHRIHRAPTAHTTCVRRRRERAPHPRRGLPAQSSSYIRRPALRAQALSTLCIRAPCPLPGCKVRLLCAGQLRDPPGEVEKPIPFPGLRRVHRPSSTATEPLRSKALCLLSAAPLFRGYPHSSSSTSCAALRNCQVRRRFHLFPLALFRGRALACHPA